MASDNVSLNPSLGVPFIESPRPAVRGGEELELERGVAPELPHPVGPDEGHFGALSDIPHLAFDPEQVGARLLAGNLLEQGVFQPAGDPDDPPAAPVIDEEAVPEVLFAEVEVRGVHHVPGELRDVEGEAEEEQAEIRLERVIGNPNFLPAWFLDVGVARSRAVCKVEASGVDYLGRIGSWSGTGFLVSENILLTNHHVLNSPQVAQNAVTIFNYQVSEGGRLLDTRTFRLNPSRLFLTSPAVGGLDFTFVWVDQDPGKEFGFFPIYRDAFTIANKSCANIIQHPAGRPKAVVVQQNEVTEQEKTYVRYLSDTEGGSSGSAVCNNAWRLTALHHASRKVKPAADGKPAQYENEGIKFSAIAAYLESITQDHPDFAAASEVLHLFQGVDSLMGFFGSLGRDRPDTESALERVVAAYRGEAADIDVGFWNIEWFATRYQEKLDAVARIILEMNLDVWAFEEASPQATRALVDHLRSRYGVSFAWSASEPRASSQKQTTTVIWNTQTATVEREEWPAKIRHWLGARSTEFDDLDLEAVEGKIFDRFPGLFHVRTNNRRASGLGEEFDFYLVPLHLKAKGEGKKRRRMAARILSEAVREMVERHGKDADWVLGGDLNEDLASGDFRAMTNAGLVPISARDEKAGQFTYVKAPFKSLIDHVFLSPTMAKLHTSDDFFIVAHDERDLSAFLKVSDHRPVLVRLSLQTTPEAAPEPDVRPAEDAAPLDDAERRAALEELHWRLSQMKEEEPVVPVPQEAEEPEPEAPGDRNMALAELEERRTEVYYDAAADRETAAHYYGTVPENATPAQLYEFFNRLVQQTHRTALSYKPATHLYPWVDLQPNRQLKSVYSGEEVAPELFIEADFEVDTKRERLMEAALQAGLELEADLDFEDLEGLRYNCEHVVPQSWFGKRQPMRGDLHHLFSCDPRCNSFRGNTPYFEFPEEAVMADCGRSEAGGFEPNAGKGAVARATLYFLLRYPGEINRSNREYTAERVSLLVDWHMEEPPDEYERHRNHAIQEKQGNRNPLIDFPRLATRIDFTRGLG